MRMLFLAIKSFHIGGMAMQCASGELKRSGGVGKIFLGPHQTDEIFKTICVRIRTVVTIVGANSFTILSVLVAIQVAGPRSTTHCYRDLGGHQ